MSTAWHASAAAVDSDECEHQRPLPPAVRRGTGSVPRPPARARGLGEVPIKVTGNDQPARSDPAARRSL